MRIFLKAENREEAERRTQEAEDQRKKNRRKNNTRLAAFVLCGVLIAGSVTPVRAADENTPKEENVYVNLNQDGSVDGIYVVNAYRLDKDTQIVDYGNYESVKNLSSDAEIQLKKGTVTVDAQAGEFFYQGNLQSAELPWEISISYTLDGKKVSARELAGKNGKLKISIHVGQNDKADSAFFENYLLQITLTMDMNRCSSLEAPGATVANVGTDKQLVYNVLAGREKDITVTADVLDFEMDGISFQGLPMNLDVDREVFSLDDLHDQAGEISDAADEFSNGAQDLEGGVNSLRDGVEGLQSGAESLKEGIDSYAEGAGALGDGIDTLQDGSNDLAEGAQELVDGIVSLQDGANQLRDGYTGENGAASGARKLADGVKQLKTGSHQLSEGVSALVDMISGLGESSEGSLDQQAERVFAGASAAHISFEGATNREKLQSISDAVSGQLKSMIDLLLSGMGGNMGDITIFQEKETESEMETEEEAEAGTETETESESETETESETEMKTEEDTASGTESGTKTEEDTVSGTESGTKPEESTDSETEEMNTETGKEDMMESADSSKEETGSDPVSENQTADVMKPDREADTEAESEATAQQAEKSEAHQGPEIQTQTESETKVEKLSATLWQSSGRKVLQTMTLNRSVQAELIPLSASGGEQNLLPYSSDQIMELVTLKSGADQLIGAYRVVDEIAATLGSEETVAQLARLKEGAAALDSGIGDLESATDALADGISQLADGTSQLADGVSELADGGSEFADGTKELADGVSELADGVTVLNDASDALRDGSSQLADGTGELLDGTGDLADGVSDLKDGTDEFKGKAGDIDTKIDEEVDGVINDLSGSEFEQISFVSDRNSNVDLVQFVMQTEGIQIPEEVDIPVEEEPMSFWQRLLALFGF